jgi:hypothetical protein
VLLPRKRGVPNIAGTPPTGGSDREMNNLPPEGGVPIPPQRRLALAGAEFNIRPRREVEILFATNRRRRCWNLCTVRAMFEP